MSKEILIFLGGYLLGIGSGLQMAIFIRKKKLYGKKE